MSLPFVCNLTRPNQGEGNLRNEFNGTSRRKTKNTVKIYEFPEVFPSSGMFVVCRIKLLTLKKFRYNNV